MEEKFSITNTDVAWLAGMIESEGSIGFQTYFRKNGNLLILPFVRITNSDALIVDEVCRISEALNAKGYTYWIKNKFKNKYSNKDICNIRIERTDRVEKCLKAILPFMKSSKRDRANIMLFYIEIRRKNLLLRNDLGQITRSGYKKEEIELVASIRLHKKAMPLEQMLKAPNVE